MQNLSDFRYVNADGSLSGYSYMNYAEGIYVGYRYYETRYEDVVLGSANAGTYDYGKTVQFPFGYGLSYTTFVWSDYKLDVKDDKATATLTVKNNGSVPGKDVVELYAQAPYIEGGVEKASVVLAGYTKTKELKPGESEKVTITFNRCICVDDSPEIWYNSSYWISIRADMSACCLMGKMVVMNAVHRSGG